MSNGIPDVLFLPPVSFYRKFGEDTLPLDFQAAALSHPYKAAMVTLLAAEGTPMTTAEIRHAVLDLAGNDLAVPGSDTFLYLGRQLAQRGIVGAESLGGSLLHPTETTHRLAPMLGINVDFSIRGVDASLVFGKPQGKTSQIKRFAIFREAVESMVQGHEFNVLDTPEGSKNRQQDYRRLTLQRLGNAGLFHILDTGRLPTTYRLTTQNLHLYDNAPSLRKAVRAILEERGSAGVDELDNALTDLSITHSREEIAKYMGDLYKRGHIEYEGSKPKDGLFAIEPDDIEPNQLVAFISAMDEFVVRDAVQLTLPKPNPSYVLPDTDALRAYLEAHEPRVNKRSDDRIKWVRAITDETWKSVADITDEFIDSSAPEAGRVRPIAQHTIRKYLKLLECERAVESRRTPRGRQYRLTDCM